MKKFEYIKDIIRNCKMRPHFTLKTLIGIVDLETITTFLVVE